jgi:competence protein ComEA
MMKSLRVLSIAALLALSSLCLAETVNINTADAKALSKNLTGVGPARAAAIVEYRESHGAFRSVEELEKVKGIGARVVASNKDHMVVGDDR